MVKVAVSLICTSCLQSAVVFLKTRYFLSTLQKVFRLYGNQTVHYSVHGSPSWTPIRMQYNPVHAIIILLSYSLKSPKPSLPFRLINLHFKRDSNSRNSYKLHRTHYSTLTTTVVQSYVIFPTAPHIFSFLCPNILLHALLPTFTPIQIMTYLSS
jgi:hypothetical protein